MTILHLINTLRPRQNGRHFCKWRFQINFPIWKMMYFDSNVTEIWSRCKGPIDNRPALVKTIAWRRSGEKPLSEPMMA